MVDVDGAPDRTAGRDARRRPTIRDRFRPRTGQGARRAGGRLPLRRLDEDDLPDGLLLRRGLRDQPVAQERLQARAGRAGRPAHGYTAVPGPAVFLEAKRPGLRETTLVESCARWPSPTLPARASRPPTPARGRLCRPRRASRSSTGRRPSSPETTADSGEAPRGAAPEPHARLTGCRDLIPRFLGGSLRVARHPADCGRNDERRDHDGPEHEGHPVPQRVARVAVHSQLPA